MERDVRPPLQGILDRLDAQLGRFDAIDTGMNLARDEAREAREETRQLGRVVMVLGQEFKHLSDMVAIIAGTQADTSKALGVLAVEVHEMNERLGRMVERNVRAHTDEVERYAALDARISELEKQWRALAAERAR